METSVRIAESEIIPLDDPYDVLLIGFSWGGSVSVSQWLPSLELCKEPV
jgi:hypothetical protein